MGFALSLGVVLIVKVQIHQKKQILKIKKFDHPNWPQVITKYTIEQLRDAFIAGI